MKVSVTPTAGSDQTEIPRDRSGAFSRLLRVLVLVLTDLAALALAGALAYALWALPERGQSFALYLELAPLLPLFCVGYATAGLYPGFGLGPVETLRRQSYVTAFGFLVLAAFSFALKLPHLYSRVTFALALAMSLLLVPLARAWVVRVARRWPWWSEPVVVIGTGERAAQAVRSLENTRATGYHPAAVLTLDPDTAPADLAGLPIIGGLDEAPAIARQGIRVALVGSGEIQDRAVIDRLQQHFAHVMLLREFDDLPVQGLHLRDLGAIVGIEYTNNLLRPANQAVKRMLDLVVAGVALVVAAPVLIVAVALVRLIDGGSVFYSHPRTGRAGRRLAVPKIRTMRFNADEALERHLNANPESRDEWDARHKLKDDPRLVPLVGQLFRRYSVDELPQLWTVLRGGMSLVGPRPFPDDHIQRFEPAFQQLRHRVRPGITGLWQVSVRSDGGIADQEAYDTYYIRNWSVWLDLYILARTIAAVASGRGAY